MRKKYFFIVLLFITSFVFSQNFCNGDHFTDSGGLTNNYSNNENTTTVITPDTGETITVTFLSFDLEINYDFLNVYDGLDATAPLIGIFDGTNIPGPFLSTNETGSLTFVFTSDGNVTRTGWDATVQCSTVTCVKPSDFTASNITDNSVDLSWTANAGETSWEIQYGTEGFVLGNGTTVQTTTNPYTLSGLNTGNYDIYIRANCGTDDDSFWSEPIIAIIPCSIISIAPYTEDFTLNSIPFCWEESGSEAWNFSTNAAYDAGNAGDATVGGNTNYAWIDGSFPNGPGHISNLKTSWIDVSNLTTTSVGFSIFSVNTFEETYNTLDVILHEQSGVTTTIFHLQGTTSIWQNFNFDVSTLITDTIIRLEFIITENSPNFGYHNDILIDDITVDNVPTCAEPEFLTATSPTLNTVDLSWINGNTETAWEIEYGAFNFAIGNGTRQQVTTNTHTLTTLNSGTTYQAYVRANCGANIGDDDSNWLGPVTFTTVSDYCNGDHFYDSGNTTEQYANNENNTTVITPQGEDNVIVTFLSFDLEDTFDFLTVYDGPDDSYPTLGAFTGNTIPGPFTSTNASGTLTFVFTSDNTQTRDGWDATVFCETVTCQRPTDLDATAITATSVELNWTVGGAETAWEIEYGSFGFTQGTGTFITTTTNPFTLNGLEQGTRQDIYIRAICGANPGDDDSYWSDSKTVSTPCAFYTAPYIESFENTNTPACWFGFGSEAWNFGLDATFTAATAGDFTPNGNTNYAYIDGSGPTGAGQISNLRTAWIDVVNITTPTVQFAVFSDNTDDQTYNTLDVKLLEQNGAETNILHLQESTNGWKIYTFDVSSFVTDNLIQLEFIVEENSSGNAYYNDILIDEIKVDENTVLSTTNLDTKFVSYYPNPVENSLTIKAEELIKNIVIYNLLGKELFKTAHNSKDITVDFSNFNSGIYFIKTTNILNKTQTFKVIKN